MARRVFFSFHYEADNWRVATVRNIGAIEGNHAATDNDWESITRGGEPAIKRWIARQMTGRSCTVVLVGANTANRPWINYEIAKSWNDGLGVVGIHVHGLKDRNGFLAEMGRNPFDFIILDSRQRLSSVARCYTPAGSTSRQRYHWIQQYLGAAVDEAIAIRQGR